MNEKKTESESRSLLNIGIDSDDKMPTNDDELSSLRKRCKLLEKNNSEQEELIKGYELENKRLYSELKTVKDNAKEDKLKLGDEVKELKFSLIQEKMNHRDKLLKKSNDVAIIETSNKKILPTTEQSQSADQLSSQLDSKEEFISTLDALRLSNAENKALSVKLKKCEQNQMHLEENLNLIEIRSSEIKSIFERTNFQNVKFAPEYLREMKKLKNNLKQIDEILKRPRIDSSALFIDSSSRDFYEKKIQSLQSELRDKTKHLEDITREWQEKSQLFSLLSSDPKLINKRFNELETKYFEKIEILKNENSSLKKKLKLLELKLSENDSKLTESKMESEKLVNSLNNQAKLLNELMQSRNVVLENRKNYEPNDFKDQPEDHLNLTKEKYLNLKTELENIKKKVKNAENQVLNQDRETEKRIEDIKKVYNHKITDLVQRHKFEIEKMLRIFTGGKIEASLTEAAFDSVFNDPIQIRLLMNARDKQSEAEITIQKQTDAINRLRDECNQLIELRERCLYLEETNANLATQLEVTSAELKIFKKTVSPRSNNLDFLKEKILKMEQNFMKREQELNSIIKYKESSLISSRDENPLNEKQIELKLFYEKLLDLKNKEILRFKNEFEDMLKILHSL